MLQSILHAAGVSAAFALYLEITPSLLAAFAAALFVALNPVLFTRVVFVLQEPAVIFFTILATWISVRLIRRPSGGRAAAAGIAWGLSTLTKVVTWYAPVLLAAMLSLPRRMRPALPRTHAALVLVFTAATIAPWTVRNWVQFHRFIPVQGQGAGMLEWNVRQATPRGEPSGAAFVGALDEEGITGAPRARALTRYILERPRHFFIDRVLRNTIHFAGLPRDWWLARGIVSLDERGPVYWTLVAIFHLPLYVFLILRTSQWLRGRLAPEWGFVILLYWTYWAEHAVIWGDPRFGLGVYPLLVGMALPPRQVTMPRSS
jgi:hypothetical protein